MTDQRYSYGFYARQDIDDFSLVNALAKIFKVDKSVILLIDVDSIEQECGIYYEIYKESGGFQILIIVHLLDDCWAPYRYANSIIDLGLQMSKLLNCDIAFSADNLDENNSDLWLIAKYSGVIFRAEIQDEYSDDFDIIDESMMPLTANEINELKKYRDAFNDKIIWGD